MPRSTSPQKFQRFLDVLGQRGNYADAMQACGYGESLAWRWMMLSRRGDPKFILDFRGQPTPLHVAVETIRDEWNESQFKLAENNKGRLLFNPDGSPVYLIDMKAMADAEGDPAMASLLSIHDFPYLHDSAGARVQARQPIAPRKVRPDSPRVRELERRLAELESRQDRITKPQGPPNLGLPRAHPSDPEEHTGHSDAGENIDSTDRGVKERALAAQQVQKPMYAIQAPRPAQRGVPAAPLDRGESTGRGRPPEGGMRVA